MREKLSNLISPHLLWPLLALAMLFVFNYFFTDGFFNIEVRDGRMYGSMIDVFDRATPVLLVALGMTLIIATEGVDLSVGAVMAISGAIVAGFISQSEYFELTKYGLPSSTTFAIAAALIVCIAAGACNGALVAFAGVQPIIATLILMVMGRGIAQLLTNGEIITVQDETFSFIGNGFLFGLPFGITVVVVAYLVTWIAVRRTALGLFTEAIGSNLTASYYAGLDSKTIRILIYSFSGLCAGVAGVLAAADISAADSNSAGLYLELDAILAVVLGGTALSGGRFYLFGTAIGALLIQGVTTTILTQGIPATWTQIVKAVVILGVCLLQSKQFRQALRFKARRKAA